MRFLTALLVLLTFAATARAADVVTTPRVEARLVSEQTGIPVEGGTISLALVQKMQPGWHTYWINPGESGEPTKIAWTLPEGFTASDIKWPHPERIPFGELANYGYNDHVLLRVEMTVPPGLKAGDNVTFKADADWLVCKDICIPEKATLDLTLPVIAKAEPNEQWRDAFAEARAAEPKKGVSPTWVPAFSATDQQVALHFPAWQAYVETGNRKAGEGIPVGFGEGALFFPYTKGLIKASAPQVAVRVADGFTITVPPGWRLRDAERRRSTQTIDGVLVMRDPASSKPDAVQAFDVTLQQGDVPAAAAPNVAAAELPFAEAILFALLGGLILNLMPCVFPILSMKALALVESSHTERPWTDGVAYLLGVLATFAALAGALLWLRAMGEDVGWGFQLQSPLSVAILAYILTLVGLNLSGVFHVGSSIQNTGQGLASKGGVIGAFFTGILAVIVAAPCTAPFMGAAMGYAFTQDPAITFAVFLALGFGLALPWVVVTLSPALIRMLPKPGPWMERFKQFLAFPMYAAAAWLVWVVSQQVSPEGLFRVMIGLVLLALAAWAFGIVQDRNARSQSILLSGFVFLLALAGAVAIIAVPFAGRQTTIVAEGEGAAMPSEPFTTARLAALRAEGRPVFVNLTAAWCVSCLYNERVALSTKAVGEAFKTSNTAYVVGDWTNQNPEISALLKEHGREGVPLYLYFAPGGGAPKVLPQILTETLILETLGASK